MTPLESAERLRDVLRAAHEIEADVHNGYGLALVSVWVGLVVWCDPNRFWWRLYWNAWQRRPVYAHHPVTDVTRAARRIALRYADLRQAQALCDPVERTGVAP
ncbi:hypothetical protein [Nonomuraea longicatena]|uniref:hypothetical protein n=1 Tax=Nonomuraea longicatena TaxID=83682 RepID=UPI0031DFCA95